MRSKIGVSRMVAGRGLPRAVETEEQKKRGAGVGVETESGN